MKISQQKNLIYHLYSCKRSNHTYCISNSDEQVWEGRLNRVALKVQSDLDHHCVSFKMLLYPGECHSFSSAEIYFYSNPTFSKKLFQDYLSVKPFGSRPRGYKPWVQSQTQNKAQWLAACGHVSASSQSLRFILSLSTNSSFITSKPDQA